VVLATALRASSTGSFKGTLNRHALCSRRAAYHALIRECGQVTLGQKQGQAQHVVSRCLWDVQTDGWASEVYESETMFCTCQARRAARTPRKRLPVQT